MSEFFKAPKTKTLLVTLCSILVVLIAFGMGVVVGYRRSLFALSWNQNYYRNFYGGPPPFNPHGVVGDVIDIGSSTLSVKDMDGNEQSVFVASATPIREMDNTILLTAVDIGDHVTIIGEPNDSGQVEARFIRVFTAPSSSAQP